MSATKLITTLYNPAEKDPEALKNEFVVRTKEFKQIFDDMKSSKMKHPEQHYLLIGQRGAGKSTLIQRLKIAISEDVKLKKQLIPIVFSEEQYFISELANLWESIAGILEDYHGMKDVAKEVEKQHENENYEEKELQVLLKHLRKHDKKLILFIDNIGDMLKKFSETEIKRLREVLMTIPDIRLVAASPIVLESIFDYKQPLLEFFKIINLGSLSLEEIELLLKKLSENSESKKQVADIISNNPSRIEILRRLTGGVVRTVVLMYNVFIENEEGSPVKDLMQILDDVTPLYKHKMDDLPTQQQKIMDALAKNWEAISTGEIAEKVRLESKVISAQLKQLEKNQMIEKVETSTKNNLYQVKERFFNIWYLMRYGRQFEKGRVIWFVKFLESWLDKQALEIRIVKYILKLKNKKIDFDSQLFLGEVYLACQSISPVLKFSLAHALNENSLNKKEKEILEKKQQQFLLEIWSRADEIDENILNHFLKSIKGVIVENKNNEILLTNLALQTIGSCLNNKKALEIILKAFSEWADYDNTGNLDYFVSFFYSYVEKYEKAEYHAEKAINKNRKDALMILLDVYVQKGINKEKAINYSERLISENIYRSDISLKIPLVKLWNNDIEKSEQLFYETYNTYFQNEDKGISDLISQGVKKYLILLQAKSQYHLALKIFKEEKYQLREKLSPVYFALMHYMKDEFPNEYLRMPPEMKETVEEVIKKVEEYRVKYK